MNDAKFDQLFDAAFEKSYQQTTSAPSADYRPSWERIKQKIESEQRKRRFRSKLTRLAVVAASLLLGALIFGNTQAAKAIQPLYETIREYPSGVISFFFGREEDIDTSRAKTTPPPEGATSGTTSLEEGEIRMTVLTEEESKAQITFPAPTFRYKPDGYALSSIQLYFRGDRPKADEAAYIFANESGKTLTVTIRKLYTSDSLSARKGKDGVTIEKIQLKDGPGILSQSGNGTSVIETIVHGIGIILSGTVDPDELIRVYENLNA